MTFKKPFSPVEIEYVRQHLDEWPSVLVYRLYEHFGTVRTQRGVRELIKRLRAEPFPM